MNKCTTCDNPQTQEEPTIFPGRYSTLANEHSYHKGYDGNQVASEFLNTRTNTTTRNLSTCQHQLTCHRICHPGNRQKLSEVIDAFQKANGAMNILLNVRGFLIQDIRYHQICIHACIILTYIRACLTYMRQVAIYTLDYVDEVTTSILPPYRLLVEELRAMLKHIKVQLPPTMHLHFYRYLKNTCIG